MKLKFTPFPTLLSYTDDMDEKNGGETKFFLAKIRPKYKDDKGLHEHEYLHVTHWWVTVLAWVIGCVAVWYLSGSLLALQLSPLGLGIYGVLYNSVSRFRLWTEVVCYKRQAKFYPDDRKPLFAKYISEDYDLDISKETALKLLKD